MSIMGGLLPLPGLRFLPLENQELCLDLSPRIKPEMRAIYKARLIFSLGSYTAGASGRARTARRFDILGLMSFNTIDINKQRQNLSGRESVWLFGYGSLIFKADFPYLERRPASITGWARRFWQGSHDHRGTPESPGRVTTLVESPGSVCAGMAYKVTPDVFDHLDVREKNGYLRFTTPMTFDDGSHADGLVYIATKENAAFLGPAPEADMARQIHRSHGPSGANREYLLNLAQALRDLGAEDEHVFGLERALLGL